MSMYSKHLTFVAIEYFCNKCNKDIFFVIWIVTRPLQRHVIKLTQCDISRRAVPGFLHSVVVPDLRHLSSHVPFFPARFEVSGQMPESTSFHTRTSVRRYVTLRINYKLKPVLINKLGPMHRAICNASINHKLKSMLVNKVGLTYRAIRNVSITM